MSYTEEAGAYFMPIIAVGVTSAGPLIEVDIGAASADHGEMLCVRPCKVRRLQFTLVGEAASGTTTPPTVVFTKRPTPGSATSESVMGTLIIPSGSAIGATVYADIDPVDLDVGDSFEIAHTIGVGTPTGQGYWSVIADDRPEQPANNSEMIESA